MIEDRRHGVHLGVATGAVSARTIDLLKDQAAVENAEARSAILFRNQGAQPSRRRHRRDERLRIITPLVAVAPVIGTEIST